MGIAMIVVLFCGLLLANIWYFLIRPTGQWSEKVKALLGLLALYTFGFGVVSSTGMLPQDLVDRLTSPDLFSFLSGNFAALGGVSLMLSLAFEHTQGFSGFPQLVLLVMLAAVLIPVLLAFWLVYVTVIMPVSYVAYVIASILLSGNYAIDVEHRAGRR
jgi:hypothetical protein